MTYTILITGLLEFDSGKTTVASRVAKIIQDFGYSVIPYKPRSGHHYWFKYDHTKICIQQKKIFSNDIYKLNKITKLDYPIEVLNPNHRLTVPARMQSPTEPFAMYNLFISSWISVFALERYSLIKNGKLQNIYLYAKQPLETGATLLLDNEIDALLGDVNQFIVVDSIAQINSMFYRYFEESVYSTFNYINGKSDYIIIESFNDLAWPSQEISKVDLVLAVSPGHVFPYSGERFKKAVDYIAPDSSRIYGINTQEALSYLKSESPLYLSPEMSSKDELYKYIHKIIKK